MKDGASSGRGIAVIVAVGAALGLLYNEAGLLSRPPRGIPWVAAKVELPELESSAPADSASGTSPDSASAPAPQPPPASATPPSRRESPGRRTEQATGTHAAPATPAPAPARADSGTGATGPGTAPQETRQAPPPFIPESDQPVQIKLGTAKSLFAAGAALFLDARDAGEYETGHIPGALRLSRDDALSEPERVKSLIPAGKPVVTYCEGGACEASLDLARALVDAGYRKVLVFVGGFPEWAAAGYPVERGGGGR
jgi:rhodanese-related sulfurtransferase